jgi:hypothetical protein
VAENVVAPLPPDATCQLEGENMERSKDKHMNIRLKKMLKQREVQIYT